MIETLEEIYSFLKYPFPISFDLAFIAIILLLFSNILKSIKKNSKKIKLLGGFLVGRMKIFYDEQILMGENIRKLADFR